MRHWCCLTSHITRVRIHKINRIFFHRGRSVWFVSSTIVLIFYLIIGREIKFYSQIKLTYYVCISLCYINIHFLLIDVTKRCVIWDAIKLLFNEIVSPMRFIGWVIKVRLTSSRGQGIAYLYTVLAKWSSYIIDVTMYEQIVRYKRNVYLTRYAVGIFYYKILSGLRMLQSREIRRLRRSGRRIICNL